MSNDDIEISSAVSKPNCADKQKIDSNCVKRHSVRVKVSTSNCCQANTSSHVSDTDRGKEEDMTESMISSSAEIGRRESDLSASSMLMASMTSFTSIFDDNDDEKDDQNDGNLSRNHSIASIDSVELMRVLGDADNDEVSEALESIHSSLFDGSYSNSQLTNSRVPFNHSLSCNAPDVSQTDAHVPSFIAQQTMNDSLRNNHCEADNFSDKLKLPMETTNVHMIPPPGSEYSGCDISFGRYKKLSQQDLLPGVGKERRCIAADDPPSTSIDLFETHHPTLTPAFEVRREPALQPAMLDYYCYDDEYMGPTDESIAYVFDSTKTETKSVRVHQSNFFHSQAQHGQQNSQQRRYDQVNYFLPAVDALLDEGNFESPILALDRESKKNVNNEIPNNFTYGCCTYKGAGMGNAQVLSRRQRSPQFSDNIPTIGKIMTDKIQPLFTPTKLANQLAL